MGSGKKVHGRTRGKHVTEPYWPPSSTRLGFKNPNAEHRLASHPYPPVGLGELSQPLPLGKLAPSRIKARPAALAFMLLI